MHSNEHREKIARIVRLVYDDTILHNYRQQLLARTVFGTHDAKTATFASEAYHIQRSVARTLIYIIL